MSHMHKDVSVDGVRVMNTWIRKFPELIVTKYRQVSGERREEGGREERRREGRGRSHMHKDVSSTVLEL
jgi:hypothetical protein